MHNHHKISCYIMLKCIILVHGKNIYILLTDRCLLRPYTMTLKHSDDIYTSEQLIPKAGYNQQQHNWHQDLRAETIKIVFQN